jgi:hypothetical protein
MPEEDVVSPLTELIVGAYGIEGLEFTKIDYPTFRAEYAWKDDDLIYHFFRPENVTDRVWIAEFPIHLRQLARSLEPSFLGLGLPTQTKWIRGGSGRVTICWV